MTPRQIVSYIHDAPRPAPLPEALGGGVGLPEPDPAPGRYYCDCVDGERVALLAGPFTQHAAALAWLGRAKAAAIAVDRRAIWYTFGTCRLRDDVRAPAGVLNAHLGVTPEDLEAAA